jgi:hypothetical protein
MIHLAVGRHLQHDGSTRVMHALPPIMRHRLGQLPDLPVQVSIGIPIRLIILNLLIDYAAEGILHSGHQPILEALGVIQGHIFRRVLHLQRIFHDGLQLLFARWSRLTQDLLLPRSQLYGRGCSTATVLEHDDGLGDLPELIV